MVFEAHERALRFFGGVCRRGIYDNMRTAVSTVFVGKKRDYNRRFQEMCTHYLVDPVACTPGAGWEKGQVERQVGDVRGRLFVPSPRGRSYAEIKLDPGDTEALTPISEFAAKPYTEEEERSLSEIIKTFNDRHGTTFTREDFIRFEQVNREIMDDDLTEVLRNNPPDVVFSAFSEAFFSPFFWPNLPPLRGSSRNGDEGVPGVRHGNIFAGKGVSKMRR